MLNYHPVRIGWCFIAKKSSILANPAVYGSFLILKGRIWLWSSGSLGVWPCHCQQWHMSSQVWYSKVWFEVDDDKYRYTFPWWVVGSVVGPLWLLWDAFFWVQTANAEV